MWLLLLIILNYGDTGIPYPHVADVQLLGIYATEKKCQARAREIREKALSQGTPVLQNEEIGCLSLNGGEA